MNIFNKILSKQKSLYLKYLRSQYSDRLKEILSDEPCIISNNCLAGFIYQDIKLPYLSPTAGLYFFFPDYIEFLSDIENNLNANIEFVNSSKFALGNERYASSKLKYPIGLLNGKYEIHFLHYHDQKEAENKWKHRVERFDKSNLILLGTELDLCSTEDIVAFDRLPFGRKCFLTRSEHDLNSSQYVKEFSTNPEIGDPHRYGHILYKNIIEKLG